MLLFWCFLILSSISNSEQSVLDELDVYAVGLFSVGSSIIDPSIFEDARLQTPGLVSKYGYNGEIHHVTTKDNYTLELHRISGGLKSPPQKGKKVCFLMHGLKAQSSQWVASGPYQALAFQLADEGYDVWMGNSRGTDFGLNHTEYEPFGSQENQTRFWAFSFHEIGVYDVPAMIDYILPKTDQQKLQYIGHSQGCTAYFVMVSEKPEYNDKIEMMHALAPAVFLGGMKVEVGRMMAPYVYKIREISKLLGINYLEPWLITTRNQLCRDVKSAKYACEETLKRFMGKPSDQVNQTLIPVIFGHFTDRMSVQQMLHFIQSVESGKFRKYHYDNVENTLLYGKIVPPNYNLKNAKAPVAVYYADSDWQVVPKDVRRLVSELPNVALDYLVPHKAFNHGDFAYGKDARRLVYNKVLKMIKSTEK